MDDEIEMMELPKLYVMYRSGESGNPIPTRYAFGPEWVSTAMFMDDLRFETEDEAVLYWYHNIYKKEQDV